MITENELLKIVYKHLPGKHDQKRHGHRYGEARDLPGAMKKAKRLGINIVTDNRKIAEYLADSYQGKYGFTGGKSREEFISNQIKSLDSAENVPDSYKVKVISAIADEVQRGTPSAPAVLIHGKRPDHNDNWVEAQHDGDAIRFIYQGERKDSGIQSLGNNPSSISATYKNKFGGTYNHEVGHWYHDKNPSSTKRASTVIDTQRDWIKNNISRYAVQNERELVAECYALLQHPGYRGINKEIKNFVNYILEG